MFKGLTARRFYKSFGVKGLTQPRDAPAYTLSTPNKQLHFSFHTVQFGSLQVLHTAQISWKKFSNGHRFAWRGLFLWFANRLESWLLCFTLQLPRTDKSTA
jgi:hypothetical protein